MDYLGAKFKAWRHARDAVQYSDEIHTDSKGFLTWSPNDVENPKEWSRGRRWFITFVCFLMVINGSMASSSPSACLPSISEDLGVSLEISKLTVTVFLLGFATGPCLWAPLSEFYGRRIIFYSTFLCYFASTFLCAFAPNIEALLIGRFLASVFIGGALSNTPGVFVDLWGPVERGLSMNLFVCVLQIGPAVGPVTSGFYQLKLNWRWNFYQLLWLSGVGLIFMLAVPETLPSRALLAKANRIRAAKIPGYEEIQAPIEVEGKSLLTLFKITLSRPWRILFDPIALLVGIYLTITYALLYMLFTIFPIIFIEKRGWNAGVGELPLTSICIGSSIGGMYVYLDSKRKQKRIEAGRTPIAEDSLTITMTGAITFPISMFWLGWSGQYNSVHWIVPTLAGVLLSMSMNVIFVGYLSYLSESYLMYAASAQAGNTIVRSFAAAASPLYTEQMFTTLGVGGGASLIGGIAVLLAPIPFMFYRYGGSIRKKSKFTPTPDDEPPVEQEKFEEPPAEKEVPEEADQQAVSTSTKSTGDVSDVLDDPERAGCFPLPMVSSGRKAKTASLSNGRNWTN